MEVFSNPLPHLFTFSVFNIIPPAFCRLSFITSVVTQGAGVFYLTICRRPVILIHMIGININDKHQPFTDQIMAGAKTIETRNSKSLHPYIGKQVGIIRTGKGKATLVGYTKIKEVKKYYNNFDKDYNKHLVAPNSPYHGQNKWGYILVDSFRCEPRLITSKGIVSRKLV